ncbi:MAG: serine/threonine protein kinase, partial [Proteobacteria bacterium]|nr:serine/threonine protein kinase [Pseudomonadota bacterium]
GDADRVSRFQREARLLASLNHPNIAAIYGLEESGGTSFLVLELVEGETLREQLERGPIPVEESLRLAIQIAASLEAAHEKGIIHRDLKPANIVITQSGQVKLLDFGLAKFPSERQKKVGSKATTKDFSTSPGSIVGTVAYMSPEQARGEDLDSRTDLFSFGVVLYEMVTGQQAFTGSTSAVVFDSILNKAPVSPVRLNPECPAELEQVINRLLEKDRNLRYQHAADVRAELKRMRRDSKPDSAAKVATAASTIGKRRPLKFAGAIILGAVCLAAIGIAVWRQGTQRQTMAPSPGILKFTQITDLPGREFSPSLSPDGKSVVYASRATGNFDIYLQRVGGRNPINLTTDSSAHDTEPAFSPDGEWIAFRSERSGGGIFVMGATGESVRRLTDAGHHPAWSPDGREIVYATEGFYEPGTRNTVSQLWAVAVSGGARRLISPGDAVQPQWSPNGQRIAYWLYKGGQRDLATVPAQGGTASEVTNDAAMDWSPAWSPDGRYLYFSSNRGGSMNLWRVPVEEPSGRVLGVPEPVTTPSPYSGYLSFSRAGTLLVYSSAISGYKTQKVGFDANSGKSVGQPLPVPGLAAGWGASPSPDGKWLVFISGRNQDDIFVMRTDGTELRQLTDDVYRDLDPCWSPDGKVIRFNSNRSGRYQIETINADGSGRRQLTEATAGLDWPVWSPDGKRVLALDPQTGKVPIFDAAASWKEQSPQLLPALDERNCRFVPISWSPDGRRLAGMELMADGQIQGVFVYSFSDRRYEKLSGSAFWSWPTWLQDSRRLLFLDDNKLNLIDIRSGEIKEILSVVLHTLSRVSISPDNRTVYFSTIQDEGDVWLATLK